MSKMPGGEGGGDKGGEEGGQIANKLGRGAT